MRSLGRNSASTKYKRFQNIVIAQRPMIKRTLWASTHFVKSRRQEGLVRDKMSSKASWLTTRPPIVCPSMI